MRCSNAMLRYLIQKELKVPTIECVVLKILICLPHILKKNEVIFLLRIFLDVKQVKYMDVDLYSST